MTTYRALFAGFIGYRKTNETSVSGRQISHKCDRIREAGKLEAYNHSNLAIEDCNMDQSCKGFAELQSHYFATCKAIDADTGVPVKATYTKGKDCKLFYYQSDI